MTQPIEQRVETLEKDIANLRADCARICSKEFSSRPDSLTATYEFCAKAYQDEIAKLRAGVKLFRRLWKEAGISHIPDSLKMEIMAFLSNNPE